MFVISSTAQGYLQKNTKKSKHNYDIRTVFWRMSMINHWLCYAESYSHSDKFFCFSFHARDVINYSFTRKLGS